MQRWLNDLAKVGIIAEIRWNASLRQEIRAGIQAKLRLTLPADLEALANLSAPPRLHDYCVSIAHTRDIGGFVAVQRPRQIGWDAELKKRVRPELVRRISNDEEFAAAPVPELLWCAKEAYFKALEDGQPNTISELYLAEWTHAADDLWCFKGYGPRNAAGFARAEGDHLFAIALIAPE